MLTLLCEYRATIVRLNTASQDKRLQGSVSDSDWALWHHILVSNENVQLYGARVIRISVKREP